MEGTTILEWYGNWADAEMAKSMLRSFGVDAQLVDDNTARAYFSVAVGGVKLRVPDSQVALARELLDTPAPEPTED